MAEKARGRGKPAEKAGQKPVEKRGAKPAAAEKPEPVTVVEEPIEKPVEKVKEKKPEKVRKKEKGAYTRYKVDENGLNRLRPFCERCGQGYFMADHGDRYSCGHCGFTRYKRA
jgi:small subunit ribosomal protein S27Ae